MTCSIPLVTSSTIINKENFWNGIQLYHDRPHLINRKLATVNQITFCEVSCDTKKFCDIFSREALLYEIRKINFNITVELLKNLFLNHNVEFINGSNIFISLRILLGRNGTKCVEVIVFDKNSNVVSYYPGQENNVNLIPPFPYKIELTKFNTIRILLNNFQDADTASAEWLCNKFFFKFLKFCEFNENNEIKSLTLVECDKYYNIYQNLKIKYAPDLINIWSQYTKTDPKKFIFEELAISAYLISLWENNFNKSLINFVDCGCGNGLLVYILNKEGFKGYGIDLKKRKLWDYYENKIKLIQDTISPDSVFPKSTTWIIGNHSDELTPWIPIIALKTSSSTNFFILPCCPYDFNGQKFIRTNTQISQYSDYLNYIEMICKLGKFETKIDRLRIPSTKRTCLIGINKNNEIFNNDLKVFLNSRLKIEFKARSIEEKARNCTQLNKDLLSRLIKHIVSAILNQSENFFNNYWNKGGEIKISDLPKKIEKEDLKMLKKEFGGLQTLIKNHRYLFELKNGYVSLRLPPKINETTKYIDKYCWFYHHHPNGCLNNKETCAYLH